MIPFPRITFVVEQFEVPSPGQQLLDRFLVGYNSDGTFRVPGAEVELFAPTTPLLESRVRDFKLKVASTLSGSLRDRRAVVLVPRGTHPDPNLCRAVFAALPSNARCFVYGLLAPDRKTAAELFRQAEQKGITILTGTATPHAFRLPEINIPERSVRKALVVTNGPEAEREGIEALRSIAGSDLELTAAQTLIWKDVWQTAYSSDWLPLFRGALSRSNTIQGDPEKDGRTQDITGLRLVEKLVRQPRAWVFNHGSGLRSAIFILDGALQDINVAVELEDRTVLSTQLYRPPLPMQDHFSGLAEKIERYFRAEAPSPVPDPSTFSALFERMRA